MSTTTSAANAENENNKRPSPETAGAFSLDGWPAKLRGRELFSYPIVRIMP